MKTLYPFQMEGVAFLKSRKRALLFDDPGLGKTTQAISALPRECAVIVTCPASVKPVWAAEVKDLRPDLITATLSGRTSFRWPRTGEVVITNPEILPDRCQSPLVPTTYINDEAHLSKNPQSKRAQKMKRLVEESVRSGGQAFALTGTPLGSWPPDLWGVLYTMGLHEDSFGTFRNFIAQFQGYDTKWGMRWGKPREQVPKILRSVALGRKRTDVLPQLPTKTYTTIYIETTHVKDADNVNISDSEHQSPALATARAKLALVKATSSAFKQYLSLWLGEAPLIVFCAHVEAVLAIGAADSRIGVITGASSAAERESVVARFKSGDLLGIAGTIGAMGTGLTLTEAWRVVFLDRDWKPSANTQAEDRVCRIGQSRGVEIIDILSLDNDLDGKVLKLLKAKIRILDASVEAAR